MPVFDAVKDKLKDKLDALPDRPGVYLFKNSAGKIIYIGKAKSLKHRVRSYFTGSDDGRPQYPKLVATIRDFEIILTRSELEALITEANLIRHHSPRYNVALRDDRGFPYIKITDEPFPKVLFARKPTKRDNRCYGPFTDSQTTRHLIHTLTGILQVRTCNLPLTPEKIAQNKFKLCLDYHIGRCSGSCRGKISVEEYQKSIDRFIQFLKGKHDAIMLELEQEMFQLADQQRFEGAAVIRDRLRAIQRFSSYQRKIEPDPNDPNRQANRDIIGYVREDHYAAFSVIMIRNGRIIGKNPFYMDRTSGVNDDELIETFVVRHYDRMVRFNLVGSFPDDILLPIDPPDLDNLQNYIHRQADRKVRIIVPKIGEKRRLIDLATANAQQLLFEEKLSAERRDFIPRAIKSLQEELRLPNPPMLIEAFDISNLFGTDSVASLVVFRNGKPWKKGYRIFHIKTVEGIDDFASIGEAVKRRYTRVMGEIDAANGDISEESKPSLPDLILIDGGKGQLSSAKRMLDELNLPDQPIVGLAKRLEEIFFPGYSEPATLPRRSSALRLLQQIRDEAHRFAISHHRRLRKKRQLRSRLDGINGIGPARRQALLKKFGSLKRIASASVEEIAATPTMTRKTAETVKSALNDNE